MSNTPLVSVIIPCHNYGRFLEEALNSLVQQTMNDWECILVDNESSDNTSDVCGRFCKSDGRFKYFTCKNEGPAMARNYGGSKAAGKYIQFLDADDRLQDNKLKAHSGFLDAHPEADLVYGSARFFRSDEPGNVFYSLSGGTKEWIPRFSGINDAMVYRLLLGNIMPVCSPLIHKRVLDKNGWMDEQLRGYEDWDLFLRLATSGSAFYYFDLNLSRPLIRVHPSSLSRTKGHMESYLVTVLEKNFFSGKMSFRNRLFIAYRYYQQRWHSVFRASKDGSKPFLRSQNVTGIKRLFLEITFWLYLPFYFLAELLKKAKGGTAGFV